MNLVLVEKLLLFINYANNFEMLNFEKRVSSLRRKTTLLFDLFFSQNYKFYL